MKRILKFILWSFAAAISSIALGITGAYLYLSPNLPSAESILQVELQIPLRVYSYNDKFIAEFGEMRRSPIQTTDIPQDFKNAILAAEDDRFEEHYGVDPKSLLRAITQNFTSGKIRSGASTITMQVAKNYFLTSEKSLIRKATEVLLALKLEKLLTKDEILTLYVNKIYLGHRAYGIEAAAQIYYGKSIKELNLAQLAMIAGLPKAPSENNPIVNPKRSLERRNWVLKRMLDLGSITQERYAEEIQRPEVARIHTIHPELNAPYIAEMVRAEMVERFGGEAYTAGYTVITTVDSEKQDFASEAVFNGLVSYDQRHGFRGAEMQLGTLPVEQWNTELKKFINLGGLEPVIVTAVDDKSITVELRNKSQRTVDWDSMKWARRFNNSNSMGVMPKAPKDVVQIGDVVRVQLNEDGQTALFSQIPHAEAALIALEPQDGSIIALSGGFSFEQSHYNRALQAKRQPGSSFKPFVYSAAIDAGMTAATIVDDAPIEIFEPGMPKAWVPRNSSNDFLGPIRVREGLYRSRNIVTIKLLEAVGVDNAINYISRFGFNPDNLPRNLTLGLGTADVTPMEVATGWAVFANGGYKIEPYIIDRIYDRNGKLIYQANPVRTPAGIEKHKAALTEQSEKTINTDLVTHNANSVLKLEAPRQDLEYKTAEAIIDERTAYIMNSMLQDVVRRGTAGRAMALRRTDLAGKTGTTNDAKDTWFSGYNPDLIATVWTGFDQPQSLGRREWGSSFALPIWIDFMGKSLKGVPNRSYKEPAGIKTLRIDPASGLLARPGTPGAYYELFKNEDPAPPMMGEFDNLPSLNNSSPFGAPSTNAPIDMF